MQTPFGPQQLGNHNLNDYANRYDVSVEKGRIAITGEAPVELPQPAQVSTATGAPKPTSSRNLDPMMVLLTLMHERTQMVLKELSDLGEDQKHNNDLLSKARELDGLLRNVQAKGTITLDEIGQVRAALAEMANDGFHVDLSAPLGTLESKIIGAEGGAGVDGVRGNGDDHLNVSTATLGYEAKDREDMIKALREGITDLKDNIKGAFQNKELDMQKISQEYATLTQTQSNLSKRWSDTTNAVVGNLRA